MPHTIKHQLPFALLYFVLVIGSMLVRIDILPKLELIAKPLLMPCLMVFFILNVGTSGRFVRFILLALFFSMLGDIFMMFQPSGEIYFLLGLGSFLIAHIAYILAFLQNFGSEKKGLLSSKKLLAIPFLLFQFGFLFLCWSGLADMTIPVIVYSTAISGMALAALNRKPWVNHSAWFWCFIGAVLFIISDSVIGMNKFYSSIPNAGILIMTFYTLGQWLIVIGAIKSVSEKEKNIS